MYWMYYSYFYVCTTILYVLAFAFLFWKSKSNFAFVLSSIATLILLFFVVGLWSNLQRPPMRTLGETRLWYSFFLPLIGLIVYKKWRYQWFLQYSLGMTLLFLTINMLHPETHEKTLMPALQSIWFVPHVVVYIFAYALLAAASLVAIKGLYIDFKQKFDFSVIHLADNLVYIGFAFLTLGLVFGALWAKEAWGDYWTWDPKETWALITWLGYLAYIHLRHFQQTSYRWALWILAFSFVILLICWFGVNYLPTASNSVHTYTQ